MKKNKSTKNQPYDNITFYEPEVLPYNTTNLDLVGTWTVDFMATESLLWLKLSTLTC